MCVCVCLWPIFGLLVTNGELVGVLSSIHLSLNLCCNGQDTRIEFQIERDFVFLMGK